MLNLLKFLRWIAEKALAAVLIVALALAAYGLWLFLRDNVNFDLHRHDLIRAITGERANIQEALSDVRARMDRLEGEVRVAQDRANRAGKIADDLKKLESTWDRLIGNPEQQKANREQLARMQALRAESLVQVEQLNTELKRTGWEKDGLEIALGKLEIRLQAVQAKTSQAGHYLGQAWLRARFWIFTALALWLLGPTLAKLTLYYGVAPVITRGRAVRLTESCPAMPDVGPSHVSADIGLAGGQTLWVKERFLQTSDEGLKRDSRLLLDWRVPFTCLASGLIELIEMKNHDAAGLRHVTLSNHSNPHIELAVVTLPEGASIVLRPSFLAGVVKATGQRLVIRRRWQLFRWQAWVTLQFRFFEFQGPCQLIVAGSRGVRAEWLEVPAGGGQSARRTNQDATIGFTPGLDYLPVRAETFWSYYRNMNPLFDDLFSGTGLFLCQQVAAEGDAGRARRIWSGTWNGLTRVLGI